MDGGVRSLTLPVVTFSMGHRCRCRKGTGKSQWFLLATISVGMGSARGQPVWPDCFRLVTSALFILPDVGLEVQIQIFQGAGAGMLRERISLYNAAILKKRHTTRKLK